MKPKVPWIMLIIGGAFTVNALPVLFKSKSLAFTFGSFLPGLLFLLGAGIIWIIRVKRAEKAKV